jgi:hypothetical protein
MSDGGDNSRRAKAEALLKEMCAHFNSDSLSECDLSERIERLIPKNDPNIGCLLLRTACHHERVNEGISRCLLEYFLMLQALSMIMDVRRSTTLAATKISHSTSFNFSSMKLPPLFVLSTIEVGYLFIYYALTTTTWTKLQHGNCEAACREVPRISPTGG